MDTSLGVIKIAYGGTLGYPLHPPKSFWSKKVRPWLWTYNNLSINDPSTRSADILIKAIKTLDSANSINPEKLKGHLWGKIHKRHVEYIKHCNLSQYFTIEGFKTKEETLNALKKDNILFLPLETGIGQNQQKHVFMISIHFIYSAKRLFGQYVIPRYKSIIYIYYSLF